MARPGDADRTILHATTVALDGDAVVIRGRAGSGKSSLALQLIALGARLVADDRTVLTRKGRAVIASAPDPIRGWIEARGAGFLPAPADPAARVALVVDLDEAAEERLPLPGTCDILGQSFPLLRRLDGPQFPAMVFTALRYGAPRLPPDPTPDAPMPTEPEMTSAGPARVVFVTGPSGAGRLTAIAALEDLGFETIDNLPLSFLPRLFDGAPPERPLALGVDVRNRDFSAETFLAALGRLSERPGLWAEALYLDARPDVLSRRYSETRRRHPLAPGETPEDGIRRETEMLAPIRARADVLIDTSETTPHELRAELERLYGAQAPGLSVSVQSFSFKRGLPRGLDMVFDVRFLQNPHWLPDLRPFTGLDARVADHVAGDPKFPEFLARVRDLMLFLLPAYADEGKTYFAVGFGCTGGQHRSVTLAEKLSTILADEGWAVSTRHRELERRGDSRPPTTEAEGRS